MGEFGEVVADDTDDGESHAGGDFETMHDDGDDGSRQVGGGGEVDGLRSHDGRSNGI